MAVAVAAEVAVSSPEVSQNSHVAGFLRRNILGGGGRGGGGFRGGSGDRGGGFRGRGGGFQGGRGDYGNKRPFSGGGGGGEQGKRTKFAD